MITFFPKVIKSAQKPRKAGRSHPTPVPVRRRLPQALHAEIIVDYRGGANSRQLAERYGVSKTNVEDLLHRQGVQMRNQPLTADQVEEAIRLHAQGLSTYKIADRFSVVQSTVWRALKLSKQASEE